MASTVIFEDQGTFEDGSRYEMIATAIPKGDEYPEGIKYRFQYMTENGRTLLRFDNFPAHPGVSRHHYHTVDGVFDDIEYTDLDDHVRKFHSHMADLRTRLPIMQDESNTNTPDDRDDEEIAMDDVEAEAGFLDDRDPEDYPSVLRITSESEETHRRDALDRVERWEAGEVVPHVINFENPSDLRALLTDRRVELLRSVMAERPDSIRQLAERLGRDVKAVHDDLQVLVEYDIVHFEQAGRAKRPFVPYETIEVNLEISTPHPADDAVYA